MRVDRSDIWVCNDCLFAAYNGDLSGAREQDIPAVEAGLARLGPYLVPDFNSNTGEGIKDHSLGRCDCCGSRLHGQRHRFAVLGE